MIDFVQAVWDKSVSNYVDIISYTQLPFYTVIICIRMLTHVYHHQTFVLYIKTGQYSFTCTLGLGFAYLML